MDNDRPQDRQEMELLYNNIFQSLLEYSLFFQRDGPSIIVLLTYIDVIIISTQSILEIEAIKIFLNSKFNVIYFGTL